MPPSKGTIEKLVGVRFYAVGKVYHFDATNYPELKQGDFVVVETTRGQQIGQVITLGPPADKAAVGAIKPIERAATGRDMALRRHWQSKEAEALVICQQAARQLELPLKVVKAEYSFDGTRLLFLYTAEDKIDTHGLKQEISKSFRARVDLKLVGPRDVAKLLGGYGACGELRCCNRFLTDFSSISIKMAKEQNISLNPQEITGICGRLRCCLLYEYEQYLQARKSLPKRGKEIGTPSGRGVVVEVMPLKEAVIAQVDDYRFEVALEDIIPLEEYEALAQRASAPPGPAKEADSTAEGIAGDKPGSPGSGRDSRKRHKKPKAVRPESSSPPPAATAEAGQDAAKEKSGKASRRRRRRSKRPANP